MTVMSFGTRATLLDAITRELDRDDLTNEIPGFLALAEADINRDCNVLATTTRATFPLNEDYENLPPDFQAPIALHVNGVSGRAVLRYTTPDRIAATRELNLTGTPRAYTIIGTEFWFDRTPNGEQAEIAYYSGLPALVADEDTNSVLLQYPALYFYGALLHSAPFLKDDARTALWDKLYHDTLTGFLQNEERKRFGAGPLVVRPRKSFP